MRKLRYVFVIAGLVLIVVLLAGIKFWQISSLIAYGKQMAAGGPPPESVATAKAQQATWEATLATVGTVTGLTSVNVSNDAPGIVTRIRFESGQNVKRGQVLVELDAGTERAQLASARARRKLAGTNAKRAQSLFDKGAIARAELDRDLTEGETAAAEVAALEAQIAKKTVRAPFAGKLGIRAITVGQYLAPGTTIASLDAVGGLFVDFSLPQQELERLRVGLPVRIEPHGAERPKDAKATIEGKLAAIDQTLDNATRNIRLRASVPDSETRLRSGMFVRVSVVLPEQHQVVSVPLTAVVHASFGDSVFIVGPKPPLTPGMTATPDGKPVKVVRQQFVRLGTSRGDFVAIAEGVKAGEEVVTAGAFKLRNNSPIVVDNRAEPKPQLAPRPENR